MNRKNESTNMGDPYNHFDYELTVQIATIFTSETLRLAFE